jgi:hypothetical protein
MHGGFVDEAEADEPREVQRGRADAACDADAFDASVTESA